MHRLIDALKYLPELDLAIGFGEGEINVHAIAQVVQGWVEGASISDLSRNFPGTDPSHKIREAATYVYSKVSQLISWGAYAYIRGWNMTRPDQSEMVAPNDKMLPAYIQYGVNTPEAAVAALLDVPRQFAEPLGSEYRDIHGTLKPEDANQFRQFLDSADKELWKRAISRSSMAAVVDPNDIRTVWRQMRGLL